MMTRREFALHLAQAGAAAIAATSGLLTACGGRTTTVSTPDLNPANSDQSLRSAAKSTNLVYGAAGRAAYLQHDSEYAKAFIAQVGMMCPEIELQWNVLEKAPGVQDFTRADWLLNFAHQNGMQFRGHSLVPAGEIPSWVSSLTDSNAAIVALNTHITSVVQRYAGHIRSWDVVNEAVNPADGLPNGMRNSFWMRVVGEQYIDLAFQAAAAADRNALLVYNDYGLEYDSGDSDQRRQDVLALLIRLLNRGVPVQALGLQGHLYGAASSFNPTKLTEFITQVTQLGLKVVVTEMDVNDQSLPADLPTRDTDVADMYSMFLNTLLQNTSVTEITTWGLSDRYTWMVQHAPRKDGLPPRPLPLDSNLNPKLAFNAMADAFAAAPRR